MARVTNAIRRTLFNAEINRAGSKGSKDAGGWELTMKALPRAMRIEKVALSQAMDLLEQAMELLPRDGLPVRFAAWCHAQRGSHHLSPRPAAEKLSSLELVARGAKLNSDDAVVHSLFGGACALAGEFHWLRCISIERSRSTGEALGRGIEWECLISIEAISKMRPNASRSPATSIHAIRYIS